MDSLVRLKASPDPAVLNGEAVLWMADGSGKGQVGDILIASRLGCETKYVCLLRHADLPGVLGESDEGGGV